MLCIEDAISLEQGVEAELGFVEFETDKSGGTIELLAMAELVDAHSGWAVTVGSLPTVWFDLVTWMVDGWKSVISTLSNMDFQH